MGEWNGDGGCSWILDLCSRSTSGLSISAPGALSGVAYPAISGVFVLSPQGKEEGVHNVHTLGFGSGRTGAGLGRVADIFRTAADFQGAEPGSSPTSVTCFPCSGACGPQSVHKLFTDGPRRGPFLLVAVAVAGWLLLWFALQCRWLLVHGLRCLELHDVAEVGVNSGPRTLSIFRCHYPSWRCSKVAS